MNEVPSHLREYILEEESLEKDSNSSNTRKVIPLPRDESFSRQKSSDLIDDDKSVEDSLSLDDDNESYFSLRDKNRQVNPSHDEKKLLFDHLTIPSKSSPDRPYSARTQFLRGCTKWGISPQSSWLIRKDITSTLDISSLGIGDEVGLLLSEVVGSLPLLEGLHIADNNLTDASLVSIINQLAECKHLVSLDLSKNKIDTTAAGLFLKYIHNYHSMNSIDSLRAFLSSEHCNLQVLSMGGANIDDVEAARFMTAIAVRQTITDLYLHSNILGSHEISNPIKRKHQSAGLIDWIIYN